MEPTEATGSHSIQDASARTSGRPPTRRCRRRPIASEIKLLDYTQLYNLWERQQWATQELDFSQDRIDWHERIPEEERFQRMYGLSSFFIGEQKVADELGPIMRAAPTEEQRIFLSTQIADEARHVRFFDRFYQRGRRARGRRRALAAAARPRRAPEPGVRRPLRRHAEGAGRPPGAATLRTRDALVEAITLYHMVIEGMLALTGQHYIIDFNERMGTLPGFVEGFSNVARDEHRHIAFGVRFLTECVNEDERYREVIQNMLDRVAADRRRRDRPALGRGGGPGDSSAVSREETSRVRGPEPQPPAQGDRADARYRRLTFFLGELFELDLGAALRFFGAE